MIDQAESLNRSDRMPYNAPVLRRFGTVAEMTESRLPAGAKDGGPNNTRTG